MARQDGRRRGLVSLPTISVIIAVYNGAATIRKAVQSVLDQSYAAHEVIVVDDGSADDTAAVVREFGGRVRYVHQTNAGVSAARNAGATVASGDWLAFLDADDWYYRDRLLWHAQWIERDPRLDFLTGDYEYRRPDGTLISRSLEITEAGKRLLRRARGAREVVMEASELEAFVEDHFGDTHTLTLPRATFMRLGGYPVGRPVCEDVNLLIRLCAISTRVGVICESMAVYLIHGQSATRTDPLRAQRLTVEALLPLADVLGAAPAYIRRGYRGRLRRARLNLAYALLRRGARGEAIAVAWRLLTHHPGRNAARSFASIVKGAMLDKADSATTGRQGPLC